MFFFFKAFCNYNFDEGMPSFYIRIENRNHYETGCFAKSLSSYRKQKYLIII